MCSRSTSASQGDSGSLKKKNKGLEIMLHFRTPATHVYSSGFNIYSKKRKKIKNHRDLTRDNNVQILSIHPETSHEEFSFGRHFIPRSREFQVAGNMATFILDYAQQLETGLISILSRGSNKVPQSSQNFTYTPLSAELLSVSYSSISKWLKQYFFP